MVHFTDIRALAFDLDGTLTDSAPGLAKAVDLTLQHMNLPVAGVDRVSTWIGNGADIMMKRALTYALQHEPSGEDIVRSRGLFDDFYAQTAEEGSALFPGVSQTLQKLHQQNIPMAIVTNKPTPFVAPLLKSLGIDSLFSLVIGGDDVIAKKPHPAPVYLVLGKFGLNTNELLFVGDSRNDIQSAKSAGVRSVGMTYGYNYGEPIADSQPDVVLETFDQLLPLLGR